MMRFLFRENRLWLSAIMTLFLLSCGGSKSRTYTNFMYPVFLNDSSAAVFLLDKTETEDPMSSPRVSKVAFRGFKVAYRTKSSIAVYTPSFDAGDHAYSPHFSLTKDILFITASNTRNPLIAIDRESGRLVESTREICCGFGLEDWPGEGRYLFRSDSGTFHVLNLREKSLAPVNPDSLFGFEADIWFDIRRSEETLSATFQLGDSLWFIEIESQRSLPQKIALPSIPLDLQPYRNLEVTFGSGSDYLRIGPTGGGGLTYMVSLLSLKSDAASSRWSRESEFVFNKDLTAKAKWIYESSGRPIDSARIVFLDSANQPLAEYDFASHIRK